MKKYPVYLIKLTRLSATKPTFIVCILLQSFAISNSCFLVMLQAYNSTLLMMYMLDNVEF